MREKMITTYSLWNMFKNCRKMCQLRYIEKLDIPEKPRTLSFGGLIHECLELWHKGIELSDIQNHIDGYYPDRFSDEYQLSDWHLANAMMSGYSEKYPTEDFHVIFLEKEFQGKIKNPKTNHSSHTFTFSGKIDGIVRKDGLYYVLEHKTAGCLDAAYIEKLWSDFQIIIYAYFAEKFFNIKISGIIYNVLIKAKLRQGKGETEAEYEERKSELLAKSKTGKTSAKRKVPESDEDFQARLLEKYKDPQMFHRELLYIDRSRFDDLIAELWDLSQNFLQCRRSGMFYRNTSYCFNWGRPCKYYPLCSSGENPNVRINNYIVVEPHEELNEEPVF